MVTALLIYFIVGILLSIVGPLAKNTNEYIAKFKEPSLLDAMDGAMSKKKKLLIAEILVRILMLFFYPFFLAIICIDYFRLKSFIKSQANEPIDKNLYYLNMGGAGIIKCNVCDFNEKITSFLHSFGENSWNSTGFQCQSCGKFHSIPNYGLNKKDVKCECGGDLDNEKPIFCPKWKTNNVSYNLSYIT